MTRETRRQRQRSHDLPSKAVIRLRFNWFEEGAESLVVAVAVAAGFGAAEALTGAEGGLVEGSSFPVMAEAGRVDSASPGRSEVGLFGLAVSSSID